MGQDHDKAASNKPFKLTDYSYLCSVEEVCEALQSAGVCEVENLTDLRGSTFCRDPLCPDTLVFSQQLHALLLHSGLISAHVLNTQVHMNLCEW